MTALCHLSPPDANGLPNCLPASQASSYLSLYSFHTSREDESTKLGSNAKSTERGRLERKEDKQASKYAYTYTTLR